MGKKFDNSKGPSQRQLRAGENVRHILVEILARGALHDPAIDKMLVTIGEVRMSPDLKHATAFVAGLSAHTPDKVAEALNRAANAIRMELGKRLQAKYVPVVRFLPDHSYDAAFEMSQKLADPRVAADLGKPETDEE